jgi:hypothetical protein
MSGWMGPLTKYEIWEALDGGGITLMEADAEPRAKRIALGGPAKLVLTFEAKTWEDANQKMHDHYGWEPYVPMED